MHLSVDEIATRIENNQLRLMFEFEDDIIENQLKIAAVGKNNLEQQHSPLNFFTFFFKFRLLLDTPDTDDLKHFATALNRYRPLYLNSKNAVDLTPILRNESAVFIEFTDLMKRYVERIPPKSCKDYQQTPIVGVPPMWYGVVLKKNSRMLEAINLAISLRILGVSNNPFF
jgi:hypothetical protein